jgi:hypothetical protein
MPLIFPRQIRGWDMRRNTINFLGEEDGNAASCAISMEALIEHFGARKSTKQACLAAFDRWRAAIERKASDKYDTQAAKGSVLLRTDDFP